MRDRFDANLGTQNDNRKSGPIAPMAAAPPVSEIRKIISQWVNPQCVPTCGLQRKPLKSRD
ncbi:MAG: hypothetical protein AAFY60_17035, partial [Myxococcota bacterium]